MNYKLYALLLTLTLAATPAMQAMRATRSLLATSRSLRPAIKAGQHALTRTPFTQNNDHGYEQEEPRHAHNDNYLPTAIAIGLGLGLTTEENLEEKEYSETIRKLDVRDAQAVMNVLLHGTEDDKRAAAHMAAKNITSYWYLDILMLLQAAKGRSHRILVNAVAKNITHFWTNQISEILLGDQQDETHYLIGRALKENYNYFTSYSVAGFRIVTAQDGIYEYATAIRSLQEKHKANALQPLAADINTKSIHEIVTIIAKREGIMHLFSSKRQIIMTAISENIHKYDKEAFARIMRAASGDDFRKSIVPGIVKNIDKYDTESLASLLQPHLDSLLFHSTLEHGECITTALSKTIEKNLHLYTDRNLVSILNYTNSQTTEQITSLIARDIDKSITKFDGFALACFAKEAQGQTKEAIISAIAQNINLTIHSLSRDDLATLLTAASGPNSKIIKDAIIQKIDNFIPKDIPGLQKLFINGAAEDKTEMVNLIANNIENMNESVINLLLAGLQEDKNTFMNALLGTLDPSIQDHDLDSQSAAHLRNNTRKAFDYLQQIKYQSSKFRINPKKYKLIFQKALRQERLLCDKYAVFYHSHKNTNYWLEILYTKLWERKHNQTAANYLFTRFPDDRNELANAILQSYGTEKRAEVLARGRVDDKDPLRSFLFFTNFAFYGNLSNLGSCTPHYYLTDYNVRDPEIKTQDIINKFGNDELFKLYQTEFDMLEQEFNQVVHDSVLLQLSIPMNALKDHVYLAAPGGYKKTLRISREATNDMPTIINTLKKAPETLDDSDEQEFCIIMTPDTVHMLRDQGAQINVYGDFDQEKLNALTLKLEALIARIAQENPQTFSAHMTPSQSYQAYKPVLDDLLQKKD